MSRRPTPPPGEGGRPIVPPENPKRLAEQRDVRDFVQYLEEMKAGYSKSIKEAKSKSDLPRVLEDKDRLTEVGAVLAIYGGGKEAYVLARRLWLAVYEEAKSRFDLLDKFNHEHEIERHENPARMLRDKWRDDNEAWQPVADIPSAIVMEIARRDEELLHTLGEDAITLASSRRYLRVLQEGSPSDDVLISIASHPNPEVNAMLTGGFTIKDRAGLAKNISYPPELLEEARRVRGSEGMADRVQFFTAKVQYEERLMKFRGDEVRKVYLDKIES